MPGGRGHRLHAYISVDVPGRRDSDPTGGRNQSGRAHHAWIGTRRSRRLVTRISRHSLRSPASRPSALATAARGSTVEVGARCHRIQPSLLASPVPRRVLWRRHDQPQRGLPVPERLVARDGSGAATGHGLDSWRRAGAGLGGPRDLQRSPPDQGRRRRCHH